MSKLISEPPLLVLPSLARELGLVDAIVLQQLYYAGQRTEDGWVQRSYADWSRALRDVIAARTLERTFANLVKAGWVEQKSEPGKAAAFRATPRDERGVGARSERGAPTAESGGSVSREKKQREKASPKTPSPEPIGFDEWLEHHREVCGSSVPKLGTQRRTKLAGLFGQLAQAGHELEEFKLESEGVAASPHMVEGGHLEPENVLRVTRFGKYADAGRRARAARGAAEASPYAAFDGGDQRVEGAA